MYMIFCCNPQIFFFFFFFFFFFLQFELSLFGLKALKTGYLVNSSYSFSWIFLKLAGVFCQSLKLCMGFSCNPQINLSPFSQFKLGRNLAQPPPKRTRAFGKFVAWNHYSTMC